MSLILETTQPNFLKKAVTGGDITVNSNIRYYEKQLGSDGTSSNTIFSLNGSYQPGSNTLMVFLNGQKLELKDTATDTTEYEETSHSYVTLGDSINDDSVIEFIVVGSYLLEESSIDQFMNNARTAWDVISSFTYVSATSFTVVDNAFHQEALAVGRPIKYKVMGNSFRYGVVTGYSSGTVTVAGVNLTSNDDIMYYGHMNNIVPVQFGVPGSFSDAPNTTLLATDTLTRYQWPIGDAYCVKLSVTVIQDDSGTNQPRVNMRLNGSIVSTSNSDNGLEVSESWVHTTNDINESNYMISNGESIEISTDANGTNNDASDLSIVGLFILV